MITSKYRELFKTNSVIAFLVYHLRRKTHINYEWNLKETQWKLERLYSSDYLMNP